MAKLAVTQTSRHGAAETQSLFKLRVSATPPALAPGASVWQTAREGFDTIAPMNRLKIFITDVRILVTPGKRLMQGYNMAEIQEEAANPEFRLVYR